MDAQVQTIFKQLVLHLKNSEQVAEVKLHLFEILKNIYEALPCATSEWETFSRRITRQVNTHIHTLRFENYRIVVTYHYLFDLSSYATVMVALIKDGPDKETFMRKALFLYDCKSHKIFELDIDLS